MRRRLFLLATICTSLTAISVVLGCGGGTPSPAVTVTVSPTPPSASPSPSPSPKQQLEAYIAAVDGVTAKRDAAVAKIVANLKKHAFSPNRDATWSYWRREVKRWGDISVSEAVDLAVIEPPAALRQAHAKLVQSYRVNKRAADEVVPALLDANSTREQVVAAAHRANTLSQRSAALSDDWFFALSVEAKRLGAKLPKDWAW
jgi:hypothetical protein